MVRFRERLVPGPGPTLATLLLLPAVIAIVLPLRTTPVLAVVIAVAVTLLAEVALFASSPLVSVAGGLLVAGPARIPVSATGPTEAFRGAEATAARGVGLDARAWTLLRGWIDPVVRIAIVDPDDPVPYWVVSTRRPEELRAALAAERASVG